MRFDQNLKLLFAVFALFTLLSLLIFWPIFFGKVNLNSNLLVSFYPIFDENLPYKNIVGLDQLRLYYPNYSLVIEQFKNLQLPHWNPYIFSGNLNIASLQSAVFYPLNVFSLFLPQIEFWHLLRISPSVFGSFFAFLYIRNLGLSRIASFFGAMSFGFSPFILTWGEEQVNTPHTIIWLPLILLCVDKLLDVKGRFNRADKLYFTLISFSVAFSVFAGFIQTTIYLLFFVLSYLVFRVGVSRENLVKGISIVSAIIVGLVISAVQLVPTAELYFNSARSTVTLKETLYDFLIPLESLITFLAPDFFGNPTTWNFFRRGIATYYESIMFVGIPALLFALYGFFENRKDSLVRFYFIAGFLALFFTLDLPTSKVFLSLPIPFLSSSIANRLLFIPVFCAAVLASKGLDSWLQSRKKKIINYVFLLGLMYGVILAYLFGVKIFGFAYFKSGSLSSTDTAWISLRNLAIPLGIFGLSAFLILISALSRFSVKKSNIAILIIIFSYAHLFLFSQKYYSFSDREHVFPSRPVLDFIKSNQGIFRSWGLGEAYLENNFASHYKILWPEGYNSLNILSYAEFTELIQGGSLDKFVRRADAGLGRGETLELLSNENRRKLIDIVGVRYVIALDGYSDNLEKNNFVKVFEDRESNNRYTFSVFENLRVIPRVFLASNYEGPPQIDSTGKTDDEVQKERRKLIPQKLLGENFDFRNVLILEKPSPISPQFGPGTVKIVSYKSQEVIVRTSSDQPKLLFLSDNFYPGWKTKVDGDETEILRADYTFRAVPLVPGDHEVRFYFDSEVFKTGLVISLLSLGIISFLTLRKNRLVG